MANTNTYATVYKTASAWTSANPYLKGDATAGQEGIESDTGKRKQGPGYWNSLSYLPTPPPSTALAADLDFGSHKGVNLATPTASTDAANKSYVDAAVTGLLDFKGATDCSANPNYPSALKGDAYVVSVAGKIGGASGKSVDVGDMYLATADNAGGTEASVGTSWAVLEHNLVGALLAANNLSDLTNPGAARTNLGLGTIATKAQTSGSGVQKADGSGGLAVATPNSDYAAAISGTGPVRVDSGVPSAAFAALLTSAATVSNTITETTLWTPANIAASKLVAGQTVLRIHLSIAVDNAATSGLLTCNVKVNGVALLNPSATTTMQTINASQTAAATNTPLPAELVLVVDATGAGGAVSLTGQYLGLTTAGGGINPRGLYVIGTAVDLSGGLQITVTAKWATASASNVARLGRAVLVQIA